MFEKITCPCCHKLIDRQDLLESVSKCVQCVPPRTKRTGHHKNTTEKRGKKVHA